MKTLPITAFAILTFVSIGCNAQINNKTDLEKMNFIFPEGALGPVVTWLQKVTDEEYKGSK
ncbi:hypothetical protein [Pedobacter antarcticus]|uniref:hypothetical protein n=1 Tax=Pedobacter antarcticus TaxID=34086 RepID=UPI000885DDE3|nr:hypothetical protein [Pedobacter antarcticus]SDM25818.1 hypothetical protein SAMN04488084_10517 [Pedobacter antarcticus]